MIAINLWLYDKQINSNVNEGILLFIDELGLVVDRSTGLCVGLSVGSRVGKVVGSFVGLRVG
jgi:hypothetical protein